MIKGMRFFLSVIASAAFLLPAVTSCRSDEPVRDEYISIEGVALDVNAMELAKGDVMKLTSVILPYGADASDLSLWDESVRNRIMWKSDNVKVATVSQDGLVTAVGGGNCSVSFICGTFQPLAGLR